MAEALFVTTQHQMLSGLVQAKTKDAFFVNTAMGTLRAERAASCLLAPEIGDFVLVAFVEDAAWVLSVLTKRQEEEGEVQLPRKTKISAEELAFEAKSLHLQSNALTLRTGIFMMTGKLLVQGFSFVQSMAKKLGEDIRERVGRYGSVREQIDDLAERRAGRVREEAKGSYRLRAESGDFQAKEQMDIDAKHIKLG